MTRKTGFTLAEVLITLGIIGVVAAMTIPTLINQTNSADIKAAFKKALSSLNQAITMNVALGGSDFGSLTAAGTADGGPFAMFTTRMNVASTDTDGVTTLGASSPFSASGNYTLFFNDGMAVTFDQDMASCTAANTTNCDIVVDVNGTKGPNKISVATTGNTSGLYDQFVMNVYNQQVVPKDEKAKYVLYN